MKCKIGPFMAINFTSSPLLQIPVGFQEIEPSHKYRDFPTHTPPGGKKRKIKKIKKGK